MCPSNNTRMMIKYLILIICSICSSAFATCKKDDITIKLISLATTVGVNESVRVLVCLPKKQQNAYSWAIYSGTDKSAFKTELLGDSPKTLDIPIRFEKEGSHSVATIVYGKNGDVTSTEQIKIEVIDRFAVNYLKPWGGVIIGAVLALSTFLIQGWVVDKLKKYRESKSFKAIATSYIENVQDKLSNDNQKYEIPFWIKEPWNTQWAEVVYFIGFQESLNNLNVCLDKYNRTMTGKEELRNCLSRALKQIKEAK